MKKIILPILILCILPTAAFCQDVRIKKGMPFEQARKILLKDHWLPVNVHAEDQYQYIGTENVLTKRKIMEVENCAMDRPLCIFNYKKADACLRLISSGEKFKDMKIEEWSGDCPEK